MAAVSGIITLFVVVGMGLLITRIATVALTFTGLSRDLARFQARSAFTGCGFTTTESERLVSHPVRRRIIMFLMLLGNGVVVMAISSLIPVFLDSGQRVSAGSFSLRLLLLVAGLVTLWAISISPWIDRHLSAIIGWAIERFTKLELTDYHSLLHLSEGYSVTEVDVEEGDWVAEKTLSKLRLNDEGIVVLGIHRGDGEYVGTPTGMTMIRPGDTLLLYGPTEDVPALEGRKADAAGDEAHARQVREQQNIIQQQERQDLMELGEEAREGLRAFHALLQLSEGYSVAELLVAKGHWMAGRKLGDLRLPDEGLNVLGIYRTDGEYVGTPVGETYIRTGDTLLLYGLRDKVASLEARPEGISGDEVHREQVEQQEEIVRRQTRAVRREE